MPSANNLRRKIVKRFLDRLEVLLRLCKLTSYTQSIQYTGPQPIKFFGISLNPTHYNEEELTRLQTHFQTNGLEKPILRKPHEALTALQKTSRHAEITKEHCTRMLYNTVEEAAQACLAHASLEPVQRLISYVKHHSADHRIQRLLETIKQEMEG